MRPSTLHWLAMDRQGTWTLVRRHRCPGVETQETEAPHLDAAALRNHRPFFQYRCVVVIADLRPCVGKVDAAVVIWTTRAKAFRSRLSGAPRSGT